MDTIYTCDSNYKFWILQKPIFWNKPLKTGMNSVVFSFEDEVLPQNPLLKLTI